MSSSRTLVLWDIDHTLINISGVTRNIYADALHAATGRRLERIADFAGRTERAISTEVLRSHGIEVSDGLLDSFGAAIAEAFAGYEAAIRERGRALPGALAALEALAERDDVVQSVLTGNMEPLAIGKLKAFGLDHLVDFEVAAYGMDHEDRAALVGLAQERAARKYGESFTPRSTVLVGDTPNDVLAGHLGGARVVAVATGFSDTEALREAGAELVLEDLSDTDAVVRAVLGVPDPR
ncbi:phosphoglycolate phosphatase-like HAD superfamily hydrolase [Streptosporangium album]|uniref:Phosphoglycolate phosphatase-like HAD superfamily hydrolase n=1 Tax=Streptosporangium album TaxID=47479 RepID=A0A7W7RUF7_9ACTN|nr:HAD family hydrolase [Streptosporangium album]MBB4937778.1 phosphoglycolate phosphatase-like HAD superfamily hydrolase [Streptosporangium album]